jgi:hypothetical protein
VFLGHLLADTLRTQGAEQLPLAQHPTVVDIQSCELGGELFGVNLSPCRPPCWAASGGARGPYRVTDSAMPEELPDFSFSRRVSACARGTWSDLPSLKRPVPSRLG